MTTVLPPDEYIIDLKYVPSYKQDPYGLCYFFTLISSVSNAVSRKYDCNLQISAWKFIRCFERFLNNEPIAVDVEAKSCDVQFIAYDPVNFQQNKINNIIYKTNSETSYAQVNSSDLFKILSKRVFDTSETSIIIDNVYTIINEDIFKNILEEEDFNKEIVPGGEKFTKKYTKGKLIITNLNSVDNLFLETLVDSNSILFNEAQLTEIKNQFNKNPPELNYEAAKFIENLLSLIQIPVPVTCGRSQRDPDDMPYPSESGNETSYEDTQTNKCFQDQECTLRIGLSESKGIEEINNLDAIKSLIANDKLIIWDMSKFMVSLIAQISNCQRALVAGKTFDQYISDLKSYYNDLSVSQNCPNYVKFADLLADSLTKIFKGEKFQPPLSNPVVDLSAIEYLYDSTELSRLCDDTDGDKTQTDGGGHVVTVYGYKEVGSDTTDFYIKNTWSNGTITHNKFIIRIKNTTILKQEAAFSYGRFGTFTYYKDKYIIVEDKEDICDCCESPSASTSSSSSSPPPPPPPGPSSSSSSSSSIEPSSSTSSYFF